MNQKLLKQIKAAKQESAKTKLVALRMPVELHTALKRLAEKSDSTVTEVMLFLLKKGLS